MREWDQSVFVTVHYLLDSHPHVRDSGGDLARALQIIVSALVLFEPMLPPELVVSALVVRPREDQLASAVLHALLVGDQRITIQNSRVIHLVLVFYCLSSGSGDIICVLI